MPILPGKRLGPYEILSAIGAGGMGEVYRARDTRLRRDLAIKVLPTEMATDPDRLVRFEKEARLASALNHPNIVTIYDIGTDGTTPYIAMELIDGSTIREILRSGPMTLRQVLDVATQIADGLAKAHDASIVHRDLKPENVMVTADGLIKILDFGLGKHAASFFQANPDATTVPAAKTMTSDGRILGTVDYMSPEQAAGRRVDFRSDQFSLGSLLCEMTTGERPFHRDTVVQTLLAIIEDPPRPLVFPTAPKPFRRIVDRCLEKDPNNRYPSTRMLATELRHLGAAATVADGAAAAPAPLPPSTRTKSLMVISLMALAVTVAVIVATVPSVRTLILRRLGPTISVPAQQNLVVFPPPSASSVVPYWSLSALNAIVLFLLAATLLALDRRSVAVRSFAVVLVLRGIVGVTATLGDGAHAALSRPAIALDAASSTLLSGAFAIFVLLYPRRRAWAGPFVLGAIALVTLVLAGVALEVPSTLGVFAVASNGTLAAISAGPLLFERGAYVVAIAVCALILAVEHARPTRPELRRSVLLVGIALATFPLDVAASFVPLPLAVTRSAIRAYGGDASIVLLFVSGALALVAALVFAATEFRNGDRRSAAGTLIASGIAVASGLLGAHYGAAPTVAGSVSFVLRGVWRFPLPVLATYALMRHHLLGIDVRLKWTLRRGTLAAIFLGAFLIVAVLVQNVSNARLGFLAGAVAAALLLFALAPLQRLAERFADAALPRVRDPRTALPARRLEAYRQAANLVLADGVLTPHKERALAALADELGIGAIEALEVRLQALARF